MSGRALFTLDGYEVDAIPLSGVWAGILLRDFTIIKWKGKDSN